MKENIITPVQPEIDPNALPQITDLPRSTPDASLPLPDVEAHDDGAATAEEYINDTVLPDDPASIEETGNAATVRESSAEHVRTTRATLTLRLGAILLASLAVIIVGTHAAALARKSPPASELLLSELLGVTPARRRAANTLEEASGGKSSEAETPREPDETEPPTEIAPDLPEPTSYPISSVNLAVAPDNALELINETPYSVDCVPLLESYTPLSHEIAEEYGSDAPCVLIIHTHGTESYSPQSAESYSTDESFRSTNAEDGVVAVGRVIAETLERHGIGCIHIETMFDAEDYNAAYADAAVELRRITSEYPSVKFVLDVHRDAMTTGDGTSLRTLSDGTVNTDGIRAAQIMLVVGTDAAGSSHSEWKENLAFAAKLQMSALAFDPELMRAINLRSASFNQQYAPCSLIVEVGTAANSINEAKLAAGVFAEAVARVITGATDE